MTNNRKYAGPSHGGPARTSPYPVSRLGAPVDLVSVAEEIQRADLLLANATGGKLEQIARQMRGLQEEARLVLERARRDSALHRAECAFRKRAGRIYHLYERPSGAQYFSMLSPDDWSGEPPHRFVGSYRLEADMAWTRASEIAALEAERGQLAAFLPPRRE